MHAVRTVTEFHSTKGVGRVIEPDRDLSAQRLAAGTVERHRGAPVAAVHTNLMCASTCLLFIPALAKHKKLKFLRHRLLLPLPPDATQKEARHIAD
jgi:hypothetical protein